MSLALRRRPAEAVMEQAACFLGDIQSEEGGIAPDKVTKALSDQGTGFASADEAGVKAKRGYEELAQQLQESLQAGNLEPRSGLGQRFLSDMKKNVQLKADYDALKGAGSTQRK